MKKLMKLILGFILAFGPLYLILPKMPLAKWGEAALTLIRGGITITVIFIGLILIILGFNELKEN